MKDVASHTATDIQELLAGKPKEAMKSLDRTVADAERMPAESGALHNKAARRQLRG